VPDPVRAVQLGVVEEGALRDDDRILEKPRVPLEDVHMRIPEKGEQRPVDLNVDLNPFLAPPGHDPAEFLAPSLLHQRPTQLLELRSQRLTPLRKGISHTGHFVLALHHPHMVPAAPENELVVLPHAMQTVTARQRRVEPRPVVQLSGRA
jgi:hypothetical protein